MIGAKEMEAPCAVMDEWTAISAGFAAIEATQVVIIKKMESMATAILAMQEDMNWVREDTRVVHEVVDKVAENVWELKDVTEEVGKPQQQTSVGPSPWGNWGDAICVQALEKAMTKGTEQVENDIRHDSDNTHIPGAHEDVCSIREAHPMYSNVDMQVHLSSSGDEGGVGEWYSDRDTSPGMCSPPCKQTRTNDVEDTQDAETQEMDMTCTAPQKGAPSTAQKMWADFRATVKDVPAPLPAAEQRPGGWVSAKRVRGSSSNSVDREKENVDPDQHEHATINLNLPPQKHVTTTDIWGGVSIPTSRDTPGTSREGARGAGRGTARGKRPPVVAPRYHTSVVSPTFTHNMQKMGECNCF